MKVRNCMCYCCMCWLVLWFVRNVVYGERFWNWYGWGDRFVLLFSCGIMFLCWLWICWWMLWLIRWGGFFSCIRMGYCVWLMCWDFLWFVFCDVWYSECWLCWWCVIEKMCYWMWCVVCWIGVLCWFVFCGLELLVYRVW